jgi:hypothetical protein
MRNADMKLKEKIEKIKRKPNRRKIPFKTAFSGGAGRLLVPTK